MMKGKKANSNDEYYQAINAAIHELGITADKAKQIIHDYKRNGIIYDLIRIKHENPDMEKVREVYSSVNNLEVAVSMLGECVDYIGKISHLKAALKEYILLKSNEKKAIGF